MRRILILIAAMLTTSLASAERLQAPSGSLGAGLTTDSRQRGRVYAEMGAYGSDTFSAFPLVFGGGFKPIPALEIQLELPVAIGEVYPPESLADPDASKVGGVALGNLHLGAHALLGNDTFRFKGGGALFFGPWTDNLETDGLVALVTSAQVRWEDAALWLPQSFSITTPMRFEFNPSPHFLLSGDAKFSFHLSTDDESDESSIVIGHLAPGMAYASDLLDAGARFLIRVLLTNDFDDRVQTALEPYVRVNLGQAFFHSRLTINLDEPLGFAFDEGKVWGVFFGGGASF